MYTHEEKELLTSYNVNKIWFKVDKERVMKKPREQNHDKEIRDSCFEIDPNSQSISRTFHALDYQLPTSAMSLSPVHLYGRYSDPTDSYISHFAVNLFARLKVATYYCLQTTRKKLSGTSAFWSCMESLGCCSPSANGSFEEKEIVGWREKER